ncbi:uncharacterized protein [Bemisia tabaci]|uniref:uncharacterized protein isoform X1 n=2 Tax=Bemisia tabaci TaxID=7038 RepID=UPI003B27B71A
MRGTMRCRGLWSCWTAFYRNSTTWRTGTRTARWASRRRSDPSRPRRQRRQERAGAARQRPPGGRLPGGREPLARAPVRGRRLHEHEREANQIAPQLPRERPRHPAPGPPPPPAPDPDPEPPPPPPHAHNAYHAADQPDFPPPPEEAERIISTLLPRVSPGNSIQRSNWRRKEEILKKVSHSFQGPISDECRVSSATQTTLPKTRHQRPYGWETDNASTPKAKRERYAHGGKKFGSLPYDGVVHFPPCVPGWLVRQGPGPLPPRTIPAAVGRHREVRRCDSADCDMDQSYGNGLKPLSELTDDELAAFSDDSLEDMAAPLQNAPSKRSSIAWEVPLNDPEEEALYTPGSTKVIGRRRRKSTDQSSNYSSGSMSRMRELDDWPDPPFSPSPRPDSRREDIYSHPMEFSPSDLTPSGTYVIRRGRKKERKAVLSVIHRDELPKPNANTGDLKRCSSTFDNIKSLLKEGLIDGLDETPPDFLPPSPPNMARVVSLPTLTIDEKDEDKLETDSDNKNQNRTLGLSLSSSSISADKFNDELDESMDLESLEPDINPAPSEHNSSDENKKLSKSCHASGNLVYHVNGDIYEDTETDKSESEVPNEETSKFKAQVDDSKFENAVNNVLDDPWCKATEVSQVQVIPVNGKSSLQRQEIRREGSEKSSLQRQESRREECEKSSLQRQELRREEFKKVNVKEKKESRKSEKPPCDFKVNVEVVQHEFGPLPPSPVEEEDDEYSDILHSTANMSLNKRKKADTLPEPFYRCVDSPSSTRISSRFAERPPEPPPHRDISMNSLKTRSVDAGFTRNHRNQFSGHRRDIPSERQTLPNDMPGPSQRKMFQKRNGHCSREESHMQNSCSLPETPIFSRGCDIPRTPHRRAPEVPGVVRTTPRLGMQTTGYLQRGMGTATGHGNGVMGNSLGQAMTGAELLRLAGGPGRGWYPRHRQPRPASVEHLDRLAHSPHPGAPWEANSARKPLTLPPNLTPKFFNRSPREALRRVTSLLIRNKGSSSKETRKDDMLSSSIIGPHGETIGEPNPRLKRGFFRSFWKRSRHYSLEQQ